MSIILPPFPVDDATLDMLMAAMYPREHGDPDAKSSSVWDVLSMLSELGGSDITAVETVHDDGSDGGARIVTMRDPHYHDNDALAAVICEVRVLRGQRDKVLAVLSDIDSVANSGTKGYIDVSSVDAQVIRDIFAGKEAT